MAVRKKVAVKLAFILVLAGVIISSLAIIIMTDDSKKTLTGYLNSSLSNAVNFSEFVYSQPLWDLHHKEVTRMNKIILQNEMIVAVNIFDSNHFFSGLKKVTPEKRAEKALATIQPLEEPFTINPDNTDAIEKISGEILHENDPIGKFELFYTKEFINDAVASFNIKLLTAFLVNGLLFIVIIFIAVTIINKPIVELARVAQGFIREKNFLFSIKKKKRNDEIGLLYNAFADMIAHVKEKEKESIYLQAQMEKNVHRFKDLFDTLQDAIDHEQYAKRLIPSSDQDELCMSLNTMLKKLELADNTMKNYGWLKNGLAELSRTISGEQDITGLSVQAVTFIANYIQARVGALFVLDDTSQTYCLTAGFALNAREIKNSEVRAGEGLAGQVVLQKK